MACQICFESFPTMYKVTCGSTVDHEICFDCESQWRATMPIRDSVRKMTCPTCRQEEKSRTVESLERELTALYVRPRPEVTVVDAVRAIYALPSSTRRFVAQSLLASTVTPSRAVPCASGRECHTRSRLHPRANTRLKCRTCREVACCRSCAVCTGCAPA